MAQLVQYGTFLLQNIGFLGLTGRVGGGVYWMWSGYPNHRPPPG